MSREDELRDILDQTADEIAKLDGNPRTWLSWMTYLLGQLELKATGVNPSYKQTYKEMLKALQDAIRNHLTTGSW